ncbi:unnamed protein product, partial [Brenthis ino]
MQLKWLLILKVVELLLTCTCIGLHYHSYNGPDIGMLVSGTYVGYLIVFAGYAAGYLMQTPLQKRLDLFYSIVGALLFVTSGAVVIDGLYNFPTSEYKRINMAKASLSIVTGAVFLTDAVLTYLKR